MKGSPSMDMWQNLRVHVEMSVWTMIIVVRLKEFCGFLAELTFSNDPFNLPIYSRSPYRTAGH